MLYLELSDSFASLVMHDHTHQLHAGTCVDVNNDVTCFCNIPLPHSTKSHANARHWAIPFDVHTTPTDEQPVTNGCKTSTPLRQQTTVL